MRISQSSSISSSLTHTSSYSSSPKDRAQISSPVAEAEAEAVGEEDWTEVEDTEMLPSVGMRFSVTRVEDDVDVGLAEDDVYVMVTLTVAHEVT